MSTELADRAAVDTEASVEPCEFIRPRFTSIPGKEAHELDVFMPGVPKDGVTVSLVEDQLTVVGRRKDAVPSHWRPHFQEQGCADYRLRIRLNIRVDEEKIQAQMEDGMLRLTLPIHSAAKPRRINVE